MIKILELFGGIGSPRCALRNIGIPVKAIDYVEIDEKAVRSYNAMFKNELAYKTQSVIGWDLKPDILIHGSPCQDFSIAGHQGKATAAAGRINKGKGADEGSGTRSSLMWETIHIIQQMGDWKPRFVIWENVKNVTSKHMIHNFNRYLSEMQKLGYTNSFQTLDARDFGLPQARERVFTISVLNGEPFNFDDLIKTEQQKRRQAMNSVHFSTGKDDWGTPQDLFDALNEEFNFTLDPCADNNNHKCAKYYTIEQDGLAQSWAGETVFCNPPYSRKTKTNAGQIAWVQKCYKEATEGGIVVVMLIPARTDTIMFHDYILGKAEIRFIKGRVNFEIDGQKSKDPAPFPSMIVVFNGKQPTSAVKSITA